MGTAKSTRKKVVKKTQTDIEFEKAKKNIKLIGIISAISLLILIGLGFVVYGQSSYAALLESLPDAFTSRVGRSPQCSDGDTGATCTVAHEIGTINVPYSFQASYNGKLADLFCIEHMKQMKGSVNYTKDVSVLSTYPGIVYILDNNKFDTSKGTCVASGSCTSAQLSEYLTQIAIWWYIDKVNGCDDDKNYSSKGVISNIAEDADGKGKYSEDDGSYQYYNNLSVLDKQAIKASKYASEIDSLVNGALNYKADTTVPNVTLPTSDKVTYEVVDDGVMTSAITPSSTAASFSSYTVTVNNSVVKVVNTTGVEQTTFGRGESFRIFIPESSIKANEEIKINVSVEATFSKKDAFFYNPDDSLVQRTVLGVINNSKEKANLDLSYIVEMGDGLFKKVESGTGDQISGATLTIVDEEGNTVYSFDTTDEPTSVTLPVGKYTVTETRIPDGYGAEKTTYEFEIKKGETTEITLNNTKTIDVPDTKINMGYVYGIGAAVIIVGIIFIVVANKTSNDKKKKN